MSTLNIIYTTLGATFCVAVFVVYVARRSRRQVRDTLRLELSIEERQHIPPSLHPVIDPNICIGSLSCVKACPEGDILGLVEGKAILVDASHCIGHSKCALECPVDAIKLVFGTKEKGVELPVTQKEFESTRDGLFIVGELGGMGLIKNAITQGLTVAKTLAKRKKSFAKTASETDVVIVGSGPAGIATAVGLAQEGLSYRLLEQGTVGGTVANYPRGKVVMSERVQVPGYGPFGKKLLAKEELMGAFTEMMTKNNVTVSEGTKVLGIDGEQGAFVVRTSQGNVTARMVVLATGLRGSPRKVGCIGEERANVTYRLIDPTQFAGRRVLVVGGGDSAVEAAIQLAQETDATVAISYRKPTFARCKPRNRQLIAELIAQNRVRALMGTEVKRIDEDRVFLSTTEGQKGAIWNDHVIVCIGGELPTKFLNACGVTVREYRGEEVGGPAPSSARKQHGADVEKPRTRWFPLALMMVGLVIFMLLIYVGRDYYTLPEPDREVHALHEFLRPAGIWGHGVGIVATLFMMSNFIYVLRKRWRPLKGRAHIKTWLTFHMFVGIMSPVVIAFHAAFQSKNLLASGTWLSLAIVVGTGMFGRFVYGLIPSSHGKLDALTELQDRWRDRREQLREMMDGTTDVDRVRETLEQVTRPPPKLSLLGTLLFVPRRRVQLRRAMNRIAHLFTSKDERVFFERSLYDVIKLRLQVAGYGRLKSFFRVWLALHVTLAVFMVVFISGHIALSLYLGYQWIFTTA